MIREKIFRLHRHKSTSSSSAAADASAQKFDFTFSNIQATQVPKGWDRIYASLISPESGKTVRKSGKVAVKNGSCEWTESFAESIWISDIDTDQYLLKFVVATGTSKSSVLGEAKLNLAAFLSSESPVLVSLPLKKCSYGTVLQVEVKCLTPKTNPRDEKWKNINAPKEENADQESIENQSETSDSTTAKSVESLSTNNITRETSYSFDSMDDSVGRQSISSQGGFGRQDSIDSNESSSYASYSTHGSVRSVRSLQSHGRNQREEFRKSCHAAATLLQPNFSSSGILKEGDDPTVQELEAEAKMWEQNARKLAADVESLRDELSDQSLSITKANMELASSRLECKDLTQEIERLKSILEETERKQDAAQRLEFQELGHRNMQKEMENEIRFQKEENEHLSLQLNRTQESNIELISILQELEETVEKQKIEIEGLTANRLNANDHVSSNGSKSLNGSDTISDVSLLDLQCEVSFLETAFQEKIIEIDIEEDMKRRVLKGFVLECSRIVAEKEHQIMNLEAALSTAPLDHVNGREGVKQMQETVRGLEEENLDLLYELNEFRVDVSKGGNFESEILQEEIVDLEDMESVEKDGVFASELLSKSVSETMLISSNLGSHFFDDRMDEMRMMGSENNQNELMKLLSDLQEENVYLLQRVFGLEAQLRYFTDKSETSRLELQSSESIVVILEGQIKELEEENEAQRVKEKARLCEMERKWLEAEEARLSLGEVNIRLQSTTEDLMEEYNSLQEFNIELREQKQNLQSRCMDLESKARTFQDCCCKYAENNAFQSDDEEKMLVALKRAMECESKLKSIISELDLKLELSEGERLRLAEDNSVLQMKLERLTQLQGEVLALRVSAQETRSQSQQLEASLKFMSSDYEELIRERLSMAETISSLQKSASKEENCRMKRNALEEKILRLEGDLIARDAICVQDAEMRNELNQMKVVNSQLLMKVKHLENVRADLQRRVQGTLEHEAKQTRRDEEIRSKSTSESHDSYQPHVQISHQRSRTGSAEASEGDNAYEAQLESGKESRESESKISQLEAELQEIRERYFEMSLNYAEVEDQREQLVMKLRSFNV